MIQVQNIEISSIVYAIGLNIDDVYSGAVHIWPAVAEIVSYGEWQMRTGQDSITFPATGRWELDGEYILVSVYRNVNWSDGTITEEELSLPNDIFTVSIDDTTNFRIESNGYVAPLSNNTSPAARTTTARISTGSAYGNLMHTVAITQEGTPGATVTSYGEWSVEIHPTSVTFPATGYEKKYFVGYAERNVNWSDGTTTTERHSDSELEGYSFTIDDTTNFNMSSNGGIIPVRDNTNTTPITTTARFTFDGKTATASVTQEGQDAPTPPTPDVQTYGDIVIDTFSYPNDIPAGGGSVTPTLSYHQDWGLNGSTTGGGSITSGLTVTYNIVTGTALSDSSTGKCSSDSKGKTESSRTSLGTIQVTVEGNGKRQTANAICYQEANVKSTASGDWSSSISASNLTVDNSGGSSTITATCSRTNGYTWTSGATEGSTDNATPELSITGDATLSGNTVTFSANPGTSERSATVTAVFKFNGSTVGTTLTITIKQTSSTVTYGDVVIDSFSYPKASAAGGTISPTLTYHQDWGYNGSTTGGGTITSGATVSYTGTGGSVGSNGEIVVNSMNTTVKPETNLGTVTVTVTLNGKSATATANIIQAANELELVSYENINLVLSPSTRNIPASGGSSIIIPTITCVTRKTYTSGQQTIINNSDETQALGPQTSVSISGDGFTIGGYEAHDGYSKSGWKVTASVNSSSSTRQGIVSGNISGSDGKIYAAVPLTITQEGQVVVADELEVTPTSLTWDYDDTTGKTISITSNGDWTISIS